MISKIRNSSGFIAFILFLVTFIWILILAQGVPLNDLDDWDHVLAAKDLSWGVLMENLFTPWSKSLYWDGQSNRLNEVTHRRTFLSVVLKFSYSLFGMRFLPFFIFSKAFFFAGSVALLFLLLLKITQSRIFSLSGVLFYVMVPAHYIHLLWPTDPICMVHFFILLGLWNYTFLYKNLTENGPFRNFFGRLILFTICGWLGMKTKEPAVILPISLGVYHLLHVRKWPNQKVKLTVLFVVLGWLVFLLIPIEYIGTHAGSPLKFHPEIVQRMYLQNYDCGFENESVSAFFSREHVWPVSIARTFGFYLLWALVLSFVIYGIARLRWLKDKTALWMRQPLVSISIIWIFCEPFFMGNFQPDPRYFSGTMIPLTILSVRLIQCAVQPLQRVFKIGFIGIVIFALSSAVFENFQHILFLRIEIGKRGRFYLETAKVLYKDLYPNAPYDLEKIMLSGAAAYVPSKNIPRIKRYIFYSPFGYNLWKKTDERTIEAFEKFAKQGAVYDIYQEDQQMPKDPRIKNIAVISPVNQGSLLEAVVYPLKRKKIRPLCIDKWVGNT